MKTILTFTTLLFLTVTAFGQEETLFGSYVEHGGFGGPVVKFTRLNGEFGILVGGYGGWLVNHTFMIGGGGFGLVTNHRADREAEILYPPFYQPLYINFGYGGVMFEYIFLPMRLIHGYCNILVGGGAVSYRHDPWDTFDTDGWNRQSDAFFVLEPGVHAELNLARWMRLGVGVSYRFITGAGSLVGIANKDLSGPAASVTVKFGKF